MTATITPRERSVLDLVAKGLTYRSMAGRLGISQQTVAVHMRNIRRKLKLNNRTQLALWVVCSQERGQACTL